MLMPTNNNINFYVYVFMFYSWLVFNKTAKTHLTRSFLYTIVLSAHANTQY